MKRAKSILIGLGGTGSRAVNNVVKELNARKIVIGKGPISCVVFDTNVNDQDILKASDTGVVTFQTSETQTVEQCMESIVKRDPKNWCPYPTDFLRQYMTDGASEMRLKSRLAFAGSLENNAKMSELESQLSDLLNEGDKEIIRVIMVASLSGGTGSGMFIQTALWLRKFFEKLNNSVTIRGIFLLPDIFVNNADNIGKNDNTIESHYANAYAAIRELNTLNRIILKGYKPERRIVIDNLFDSDNPPKNPVYDYCFFVDNANINGGTLKSIDAYEKFVANLIYMQLYAPLTKELYSVEDNNYKIFAKSRVPLYGACGASRAVYPSEQVLEYCALRATKDSLSKGWRKLDVEIDAMVEEHKEKEREGIFLNKIDPRAMYVKLFDEKSNVPLEEAGKDKLFIELKSDVVIKSEYVDEDTGETVSDGESQDKIDAFVSGIQERISEKLLEDESLRNFLSKSGGEPTAPWRGSYFDTTGEGLDYKKTKEAIIERHNTKKSSVPGILNSFDKKSTTIVDELERNVFPMDMGAVNVNNDKSIYGLFVKKNSDGSTSFVHPIAARYLLYKLMSYIKSRTYTEDAMKQAAINTVGSWDDSLTKDVETSLEDLADNSYWVNHKRATHIDSIINSCYEYNKLQFKNILSYEQEVIEKGLWLSMIKRLNRLVELIEVFFKDLPDVSEIIDDRINANCAKSAKNALAREIIVNASKEQKEAKYLSLGIDVGSISEDANKQVINSLYGIICAERRPKHEENKKYIGTKVSKNFLADIVEYFESEIKRDYSDKIYLGIYGAIAAQSDFEYKGTLNEDAEFKNRRHLSAAKAIANELKNKAAPALIYKSDTAGIITDEEKEKDVVVTTSTGAKKTSLSQRTCTFWGHSKALGEEQAFMAYLGTNKDVSGNDGYSADELCCYSSVYGISAFNIAKFNELNDESEFYTSYQFVIEEMMRNKAAAESDDSAELALVQTPHLDKTWHEFLPYVSEEKQKEEDEKFYRTFWLAIAYGAVSLKNETYQLQRAVRAKYNTNDKSYNWEALLYDGKAINRAEISKLLFVLKNDGRFMTETASDMEERRKADFASTSKTYVTTDMYSGFVGTAINPIDLVATYNKEKGHSASEVVTLVSVLGDLVGELVDNFDLERTAEEEEKKKYELCRDIYDEAKLKNADSRKDAFATWLNKFKVLKLKCIDSEAKKSTAKKSTAKKSTAKKSTSKSKKTTTEE